MYTARTLNINVFSYSDSLRINGTFLLVKNRYPEHHVSINLLCTTAAPYSWREGSTDDNRIRWHFAWCLAARKHITVVATFEINGKIAVSIAAADSRMSRNKRGTETDYYAAKFYALYSVFLMHNHYHRGRLGPGLWHAISGAMLSVIRVICRLRSRHFFFFSHDPSRRDSDGFRLEIHGSSVSVSLPSPKILGGPPFSVISLVVSSPLSVE